MLVAVVLATMLRHGKHHLALLLPPVKGAASVKIEISTEWRLVAQSGTLQRGLCIGCSIGAVCVWSIFSAVPLWFSL